MVWERVHDICSPLLHPPQHYSPSSPQDTKTILLMGLDVLLCHLHLMPSILGIMEGHPACFIKIILAKEGHTLGESPGKKAL